MTTPLVLTGLELALPDTHVLDTALLFASELGAEVLAVHALDLGTPPDEASLAGAPAARALRDKLDARVDEARRELDAIAARHATFGVPLEMRMEDGRPFEALARLAEARVAEGREVLIVVGSGRMQGNLVERLLGSTADQLLRHASVPVLVVPHAMHDETHRGGVTRSPHGGTWLVAIDGSEPSSRALALAARWSERTRSALALVHASSDRESRREMHAFVGQFPEPRVASLADDVAVIEDTPAEAVLAQAEVVGAKVIAIGSHGRSGLARAFFGSVAASVVRGAKVPVLCVR